MMVHDDDDDDDGEGGEKDVDTNNENYLHTVCNSIDRNKDIENV